MKKAIFTLIAIVALISLVICPEKVTLSFVIDYSIRLALLAWSANGLCKLYKNPVEA